MNREIHVPLRESPEVEFLWATRPASVVNVSTPEGQATAYNSTVARGQQIFSINACGTCHGVDALHGTVAAPALAGTASLLPESVLDHILKHHTEHMQKGGMPLTNFNQRDRHAIIAYIRSLPNEAAALDPRGSAAEKARKN